MCQAGFLVLTLPVRTAFESVGNLLLSASKHVRQKLYIKLEPAKGPLLQSSNKAEASYLKAVSSFLPILYSRASSICTDIDVRLILTFCKRPELSHTHVLPPVDVILTDTADNEVNIRNYVKKHFNHSCLNIVHLRHSLGSHEDEAVPCDDIATYNTVILGGTFDRLHNGHKVLLSSAVLRARKKLVVGITDGAMLKRKFLWEMIEPIEKRKSIVKEFLQDIDPSLEYSIVPIYDPFGPSVEDPDMDCIVVSSETKRGGDMVNDERAKRNMKPLSIVMINLVEDSIPCAGDEVKVSSSNKRRGLLGTYLREPAVASVHSSPLCIALIGHENSRICMEIEKLGAFVIDCELVLYNMLVPKSEIYSKLVQELGQELVESNGQSVNKEKLYYAMLMSKTKQEILRFYMEQKLKPSIEKEIDLLEKKGASVILLKLPTFLGVECVKMVHQVWGSVMPENERLQKLKLCYKLTDEKEASQLLANELSNSDIIHMSNVVFCPHGSSAFISRQVNKAWEELKIRRSRKEET